MLSEHVAEHVPDGDDAREYSNTTGLGKQSMTYVTAQFDGVAQFREHEQFVTGRVRLFVFSRNALV